MTKKNHLPIPRIVLFLDILGFKEKVGKMSADPALFTRVREMLNAKREEFQGRQNSSRLHGSPWEEELEVTQFSDSLVYSFPLLSFQYPGMNEKGNLDSDEGVASNAIGFASMVSAEWCALGFFTRGGIACGWTYHRGNTVFGAGIIAAYELESQVAKVPRIVVADEVVNLLPAKSSSVRDNLLARDSDGCWFVRPFAEFVRVSRELSRTDEVPARISIEWDKMREKFPQDSEEDFQKRREGLQERYEDYQKARDKANEDMATMLFEQFPQLREHIQRELGRAKKKGLDRVAKYRWLAYQFNVAKKEIAQHINISVATIKVR
jgi:hypothetical protein